MTRGTSGRIVIEVDPELKRRLHAAVALRGKTLKDWFLECTQELLSEKQIFSHPLVGVEPPRQSKEE